MLCLSVPMFSNGGTRTLARLLIMVTMARGEVQEKLSSECEGFLYMGTLPQGLNDDSLKIICQYYHGKPRFVTLYDTCGLIPIYSAYTFKRSDGSTKTEAPWMYEPQLATSSGSRNMEVFPDGDLQRRIADTQAVLLDYSDTVTYERGQLNPEEHQSNPGDKAATYTLTNAVPRDRGFNVGPWKDHERTIRRRLNNYCLGTAYVVTGVTTSGRAIRRDNVKRVVIPTFLWSAYCCPDFDRNAPPEERSRFPAFGAHGLNDRDGNRVQEMSLQDLQRFLREVTYVGRSFQIFYSNCVTPQMSLKTLQDYVVETLDMIHNEVLPPNPKPTR